MTLFLSRPKLHSLTLSAGLFLAGAFGAQATEITIVVTGIEKAEGEIGCALYAGTEGFPLDPSKATQQWQAASTKGVECVFEGLESGAYAVAVSQDFNGNRETDTNFVGIPQEPWGVSNNIRPFLRPPTFDEAAVHLGPAAAKRIEVEVAE